MMTDKERQALLAALDSLYEAGFPAYQVLTTAEKIGIEWKP